MAELIFFIDEHAGRHQQLQRARVHFSLREVRISVVVVPLKMLRHQLALDPLQRIGDVLVGWCASRAVVHEDFLIGAEHTKDIVVIDDRFRPSQKQVSTVIERHMEDGEQISLQYILEIDQQVSAADQIEPAEGRILENIVLGKYDHLPYIMIDRISVSLFGKKTGQAGDRNILLYTVPVDAPSGNRNGVRIQICGEDFNVAAKPHFLHGFRKQDRDGVGLLTCGTAGHPDTDLVRGTGIAQKGFDDTFFENVKIVLIPEKTGDSDQNLFGQKACLLRIVGHVIDIFAEVAVMRDNDSALDAPQHCSLLVIGIVDIRDIFQNRKDL